MSKKLTRIRDGNKIHFQVEGFDPITVDAEVLILEIRDKLVLHGLSQKVGDSAAGQTGKDAYDSILSTWEALKSGKWSERVAGAPKLDIKKVRATLEAMSSDERRVAEAALLKLGFPL